MTNPVDEARPWPKWMQQAFDRHSARRRPRQVEEERFPVIEAGEWVRPPVDEPYLMKCCDCGLVHALRFDHDAEGRILMAAWRVNDDGSIDDD